MSVLKDMDLSKVAGGIDMPERRSFIKTCPSCGKQFDAEGNIDTSNPITTEYENGKSMVFEFVCPHCGYRFT